MGSTSKCRTIPNGLRKAGGGPSPDINEFG
jgi:hypothetical protein